MSDKVRTKNLPGLVRLRPDNFTPVARTPWGGTRISALKAELLDGSGLARSRTVGESWEFSAGPDFPSLTVGAPNTGTLNDLCASDSEFWLGRHVGGARLLVKLVDASEALSVQIHPDDDDALGEGESGKPEAWVILDAEPGAGLYLGFATGVDRDRVESTILEGGDLEPLLQFVPVKPGDVFDIEPGTPHAIGGGVMLLEPQRVVPAKRGVTFRYWDWNRTYDRDGVRSASGESRELHLERALDVTSWNMARGGDLLKLIRARAGAPSVDTHAHADSLLGESALLHSTRFEVKRLHGSGELTMKSSDVIQAITVLEGYVGLHSEGATLRLQQGETAAIAAGVGELRATLERAHAVVSSAR